MKPTLEEFRGKLGLAITWTGILGLPLGLGVVLGYYAGDRGVLWLPTMLEFLLVHHRSVLAIVGGGPFYGVPRMTWWPSAASAVPFYPKCPGCGAAFFGEEAIRPGPRPPRESVGQDPPYKIENHLIAVGWGLPHHSKPAKSPARPSYPFLISLRSMSS